jgi:hypothetical protein
VNFLIIEFASKFNSSSPVPLGPNTLTQLKTSNPIGIGISFYFKFKQSDQNPINCSLSSSISRQKARVLIFGFFLPKIPFVTRQHELRSLPTQRIGKAFFTHAHTVKENNLIELWFYTNLSYSFNKCLFVGGGALWDTRSSTL